MAAAVLMAVLIAPWATQLSLQRRAQRLEDRVGRVARAVESYRRARGRWPDSAPPATAPPGLAPGGGILMSGPDAVFRWSRVLLPPPADSLPAAGAADTLAPPPPAPASIGLLTIRAGDPRLLPPLLAAYGEERVLLTDSMALLLFLPPVRDTVLPFADRPPAGAASLP